MGMQPKYYKEAQAEAWQEQMETQEEAYKEAQAEAWQEQMETQEEAYKEAQAEAWQEQMETQEEAYKEAQAEAWQEQMGAHEEGLEELRKQKEKLKLELEQMREQKRKRKTIGLLKSGDRQNKKGVTKKHPITFKRFLTGFSFIFPKKVREEWIGDTLEDMATLRKKEFSRLSLWAILFFKIMLLSWATFKIKLSDYIPSQTPNPRD